MAAPHFLSILLDAVFPPRISERTVRNIEIADLSEHLLPTFFETEQTQQLLFLLPYQETLVKSLILEAKYHGSPKAWSMLGQVLADFLAEYIEDANALSTTQFVLVPIPLSAKRRKSRGYNQSEEICKAALRIAPYFSIQSELLSRTRDTAAQTTLNGAGRRTNLKDAFSAPPLNPSHTYIVVDDVVTTGATLTEAMTALQKAGATRISGLALAH